MPQVATNPATSASNWNQADKVKMRAEGLSKHYGDTVALHPIDLELRAGELLTLLGPSGSGKTTLLQIISGLVPPTSGRLYIDGADRTHSPVHQRDIGVVFQNYALFPHLTVYENIAFPLQMRGIDASSMRTQIGNALEMVNMETLLDRYPRELSGGQQQRVALARCLIYRPSLILMDESLSALDRKLRENMQVEIKRIHRETGSTIIFVTHDQEEALALSDRVCLLSTGRIEQIGTPEDIYERPRTTFVADFIGISNKLRGTVAGDCLATPDGSIPLPAGTATGEVTLVVRPEHVRLADAGEGLVQGRVIERIYGGAGSRVMVRLASGAVMTVLQPPRGTPAEIADEMEAWVEAGACDGFMLSFHVVPDHMADFVRRVTPELQRRERFRREYTGRTLRENLGLARPENRYAKKAA
jgi:putative spermidine/putrescine transport system ATP-binding protein